MTNKSCSSIVLSKMYSCISYNITCAKRKKERKKERKKQANKQRNKQSKRKQPTNQTKQNIRAFIKTIEESHPLVDSHFWHLIMPECC